MATTGPQGSHGTTPVETGRFRQRRRTRAAIVDATAALVRSGVTPSVGDIAEAADVSRRTVYAYFPTLEQLLLDATLGLLAQAPVDDAIDSADVGDDAAERVAAMIRALGSMSTETLPLGRSLIRLTVDAPRPADGATPIRGYRRIGWIERALEPLHGCSRTPPSTDSSPRWPWSWAGRRSSCCRTSAVSATRSSSTSRCGPPTR